MSKHGRREFLVQGAGALLGASTLVRGAGAKADLVIIGGGLGGVAGALAALEAGARVVLVEETDWLGGQLTQQGVPPDEHPWIEEFGAPRSYLRLRRRIRDYYQRNFPLSENVRPDVALNPGNCWVSRLCHEPRVAVAVLEEALAPYLSRGQLTLLLEHRVVKASTSGNRLAAVRVVSTGGGIAVDLEAPFFLDATELGDLLPLAGAEYVIGAESRKETGELHAPEESQPGNQQAFTRCFAVDYVKDADFTIDPPQNYRFWKAYVPRLDPPWPGPLLSLTYTDPFTLKPLTGDFDPRPEAARPGLWSYRRLRDPMNFRGDWTGVSVINWPQNDYLEGTLVDVSEQERERHLDAARQLSLSLLYWLQTEAPRPDGGVGWQGLRLRGDLLGGREGMAKSPYIRESRRIRAEFTILEQHVGTAARKASTGMAAPVAEPFPDSVGIGSYRIDLHPSTGGNNYIDISSLPFEIPLGALIPIRMENLIPACKNIGTTHITNGCYRVHPVEWTIGEVAGSLAAFCVTRGCRPREVRNSSCLLESFQRILMDRGVPLHWPEPARTPR